MGAGTLWQCQASGCARGWRCTVRSLLCRPRLASALDLELPATVVAKLKRLEEATVDTAAGELIELYVNACIY